MKFVSSSVHMSTYRQQLLNRYARVSAILETDLCLAQQVHREVRVSAILEISVYREVMGSETSFNRTFNCINGLIS